MIPFESLQHVSLSRTPGGWHVVAQAWGRTFTADDARFLVALAKAVDFAPGPTDDGGKRVAA